MDTGDSRVERDRAMVESVLAERDGAFTALVEQHQRLVWHLVYRMVQHPEDCRELSQVVFLRVHEKLRQFRFESTLATWIGRIAYNVCARHLQRKRLPLVDPDDNDVSPVETIADHFDLAAACADQELVAHLNAAVESLPPLKRTVITLYYLEELAISEVAEITETPAGTVKNLLFRARAQLKAALEQTLGDAHE